MNVQQYRGRFSLAKKIPLHYQKRYVANKSSQSFNVTLMTGHLKNKIKTLLKTNRVLAVALQNDKTKKEELLEECKANAKIIMFSRLKLATLSENFKKVVTVLDETLALLQMHSSVSSSKITPKNTLGREEFKEKVKEVCMDSIPEEPKSHEKQSAENDPLVEKIQINALEKNTFSSRKPRNSNRKSKHCNVNETSNMQKTDRTSINALDGAKNYRYCELTAPVKNCDENSPAKMVSNSKKKLSCEKKVLPSVVCREEPLLKSPTKKRGSKISEHIVSDRVKSLNDGNKQNISPLKSKFNKDKLQNNDQIADNGHKRKSETKNPKCMLKKSVSPRKSEDNIGNDAYLISSCDKENADSNKKQNTSKKIRFLEDSELQPITSMRNSPLKSFSSKNNIENFKSGKRKSKTYQIDDIITTNQKKTSIIKSPEIFDTSKSYLQDLTLHQQAMVKNLAENTFLVTAEVHKNSEIIESGKLAMPDDTLSNIKQPIVLLNDIFRSGKSFCKNISRPDCDELIHMPLELQLLEHCSSLKVIPEESIHSQDDFGSVPDQNLEKDHKIKSKNVEPTLSVEEEIEEQSSHENRKLRKRSGINYKELPLQKKLRR